MGAVSKWVKPRRIRIRIRHPIEGFVGIGPSKTWKDGLDLAPRAVVASSAAGYIYERIGSSEASYPGIGRDIPPR